MNGDSIATNVALKIIIIIKTMEKHAHGAGTNASKIRISNPHNSLTIACRSHGKFLSASSSGLNSARTIFMCKVAAATEMDAVSSQNNINEYK